ncbi:unnamed protein product [Durusdinium trenchii]|uniref:Peptidase M16 C-terminal domain-containing protein n=1 Tax=Durusdinium trenchii TaxID=1381693 RepID=A0ABP0N223_9DINO
MGPLAYISIGWEAVPYKSPDAVTFMVMQAIIGKYKKNTGLVPGTISGNRTINAVANKMGVGCAEEYETIMHFYKDTGVFGFYTVCDEVAVEHAVGELMFGINLLSFSVTDEEVERAKRELKASLVNGSGSTQESCNQVGKEVLAYGRGIPPAEMMSGNPTTTTPWDHGRNVSFAAPVRLRIDAVDAEEVKRVAYKYCNDQEISVTGLGPLHGMPELYILRQATQHGTPSGPGVRRVRPSELEVTHRFGITGEPEETDQQIFQRGRSGQVGRLSLDGEGAEEAACRGWHKPDDWPDQSGLPNFRIRPDLTSSQGSKKKRDWGGGHLENIENHASPAAQCAQLLLAAASGDARVAGRAFSQRVFGRGVPEAFDFNSGKIHEVRVPAQERLQELELLGTEGEALQLWRVKHEVKALTVLREVELQKQSRPGFVPVLLEAYADASIEPQGRYLAVLMCKNARGGPGKSWERILCAKDIFLWSLVGFAYAVELRGYPPINHTRRGWAGKRPSEDPSGRSTQHIVLGLLYLWSVHCAVSLSASSDVDTTTWWYSTAQGAENCIERVIVDLVLAQVTLSGMGLDPISIGIWTLISLGLCFGLCSSELVAVPSTLDLLPLLVPLCLLAATSIRPREPEVEETSEEKKPEVKVQQCLKLVLQQLRVPLQLALHEGADGQLLQQRIQQIWQLLAGLDQQLEQHFTDRVLESLGSASKVDLVLGHRSDWWRLRGEHEFRRVSTDGSRVSPAMKESPLRPEVFEVSTSIGSGAHWEVLPDAARLELEVDLERDGMPVTEVKYLLPESQGEEIFLHNLCEVHCPGVFVSKVQRKRNRF